jgi:organic radical activating enzyme
MSADTMPRADNETDLQYKRRVIDIKSESFCGAKWYNATIWLGSGMTTSCHHPLPHKVEIADVLANPKALHNTPKKKSERAQMQRGERPAGCEYCWKIEDSARDNISDRVYKTVIYSDSDLALAHQSPADQDVDLQTLEIAFDRTCNFACSYCNPAFSSTWVTDLKKHGPYVELVSDGRNHFTHAHDSSQLYKYGETNPYVEAFFRWWDSDLHKTLQELRLTGGEPMMSGDTWRLLDWFTQNDTEVRFAMNSNLGAKPELIDRMITVTHDIKHFHLYTSNEAMGAQSEYIRDGLVWADWKNNMERVLNQANLEGFHMMCTINALCLDSLPEFLDYMLTLKSAHGKSFPTFTLNILRFPSFQSPLVLPDQIRTKYKDQLDFWLSQHHSSELLHQMEINQIQRLVDYLDVVKTPHTGAADQQVLQSDFRKFYEQYDQRRGKNFCDTFPNLAQWFSNIDGVHR